MITIKYMITSAIGSIHQAFRWLLTTRLFSTRRRIINVLVMLAGITMVILYSICAEACRILQGSILGIDLVYVGFLYAGGLIIASLARLDILFLGALSVGLGAEIFLVGHLVANGQYCYYCMSFALGVTLLFFINLDVARRVFGKLHLGTMTLLGFALLVLLFEGGAGPVDENSAFLPGFGEGETKVRIYTDHLCEQCRLLEPRLQPVIADLVKRGVIHATFIDTSPESLYSKYYLYSLKARNDLDRALLTRTLLLGAQDEGVGGARELEKFLNKKGVTTEEFDVKPTARFIRRWIDEDHISSTPSCVIQNGEKRELYVGSANIMKALAAFK